MSYRLKIKTIEHLFPKCYVPNVQIKDFNVLIDGKSFFDFPVKNNEETYEGTTLRMSLKMLPGNDLPHEVLLTTR